MATIAKLLRRTPIADTPAPTPARPALDAFHAHTAKMSAVKHREAKWAALERTEDAHLQAYTHAQARVGAAIQRLADALATIDRDSDGDRTQLYNDVLAAREQLAEAKDRGELARATIARVNEQRQPDAIEFARLRSESYALHFAAHLEHIGALAPALLAAETAYRQTLIETWAAVQAANEVVRGAGYANGLEPLPELPLDAFFTPRPRHAAFLNDPPPERASIREALDAVALRIAREI